MEQNDLCLHGSLFCYTQRDPEVCLSSYGRKERKVKLHTNPSLFIL